MPSTHFPRDVSQGPGRLAATVLAGGGEMGAIMRATDWAKTPVGPVEAWPQSLRTAVSILLASRQPMFIWWGEELVQFYNDAYLPSIGPERHPGAVGQRGRECWAEIWPVIGPLIDQVRLRGEATWAEDQLIPITRGGFLQDVYWTFGYSPIRDEAGAVGGVLVQCAETTPRVLAERRLCTLRDLAACATGSASTDLQLCERSARVLAENASDLRFVRLYLTSASGELQPVSAAGAAEPGPEDWPLARAVQERQPVYVPARQEPAAGGAGPRPATYVLPFMAGNGDAVAGVLVAGLSPRLPWSEPYRSFLELAARQVGALVAAARSLQEERSLREEALRSERAHAQEADRLLGEAERATRSREETLAIVSHDLRSPLGTISTAAQLLQRSLGPGEQDARLRKHADAIHRAAGRMNRLVGDLLDLASIDSGSLALDPRPCAAEELVREVCETHEPLAQGCGVRLETGFAQGLPPVTCDRERILQVLGNLLSNALKFTPRGGTVRVCVAPEPAASALRFSVQDTGPGVPPEAQAHIFDRNWHAAQKRREGHGMGLSIARGIVESHGGHIRVEASPEAGSTFSFSLPLEPQVAPAVLAPAAAPAPRTDAAESFLQAGGEMGAMMRAFDWSRHSLGPVERWPQSLRTSVSTMLRSPYPIILFWGPERVMLYNDPFRPILGTKHPATLGARGREALAEEWSLLGPLMERVYDTGEPLFIQDGNVNFARRPGGLREEAYFTWSYNPTIGESGEIAGLFAIASETTRQVVGDRQLAILRELSIRAALDQRVDHIFHSLEAVLAQAGKDLPFALLYVVRDGKASLVSCSGLARGTHAAPAELGLGDTASWPLERVVRSGQDVLVDDLLSRFGALPGGPWPEPASRALLLPVAMGAEADTTGVLVAGLSPLRAVDDEYRGFLQLLARQLAASISSARAYEHERRRAEELAKLDQAKTAFFSNVSHELRTPLTLILGPVEDALAKREPLLEGESLDLVRRNALRLYKLVNTLLDFSRLEAGRAEATFVPTDLSRFTVHLASAFESAATSAGLALRVDCPPLPEPVHVDPDMWEKVVLNLLSNAVKYTHRGEVRVQLGWSDEGPFLRVQDTGVGIPEEERSRIFERFYRVRSTEGRSHEGTGIGLALVQELVRLHGGSVSVASRLGEGSTFTVRLPRGSAHLPRERVQEGPATAPDARLAAPFVEEARRWSTQEAGASGVPAPGLSPQLARAARILLVDDNADLRSYVSELLRRSGPHVQTATNGREALALARAQPPDLILSDVMMPELDGFGLVRALREDERTRAVPIILLSARAGDESTVEGLESGADDYLVKPFSARELLARVQTQLEMARVRRDVARHEHAEEQLRAMVKERDEWLTVVSHELRTPLSALALSVQSLIRAAPTERAGTAQRNLQRLTRQVEQLVDVAALIAGQLELAPQELDLAALVAASAEEAQEKAARLECRLSVSAPAPVVGAWDRTRVRELVDGLLDNALKFGAGQPVELSVAAEGAQAVLRISDHGEGVAPEDEARIFGRFARAAPTRNHGGFGLGLWMASRIVEAHGGSIQLSRTQGGGATFTVLLPLAPASARPGPGAAGSAGNAGVSAPSTP